MRDYAAQRQAIKQQGQYRHRRQIASPQGPRIIIDGKPCLSFCSNDYLGLANHPVLIKALQTGAQRYGVGSGASHLVNGHSSAHHELEEALADFTGRARALLFSSGYLANLGIITSFAEKGDTLYQDRLNHASLIDGGRLSGARLKRYAHNDMEALSAALERGNSQTADANLNPERFIISDGVFSMDGDIAPVNKLARLAKQHQAMLIIDDAHGIGVLGSNAVQDKTANDPANQGQGTLAHLGVDNDEVHLLMGTLGKAFGTAGAFVAGSEDLIEMLIQKARSYTYTTALPPAIAVATLASLKLVRAESWRREKLQALIQQFRAGAKQLGLPLGESHTPIQPLIIGESAAAVAASHALMDQGIQITAIRPPTVPKGSARLRITLSAAHESEHIDQLLDALEHTLKTAALAS